jgi:uncharacterized protein (DUF58 family)
MLTARGFWFLVALLFLLGLAALMNAASLLLISSTLLSWFLVQWGLFHWQWRRAAAGLTIMRTLRTARGEVQSLWAGQRAEVQVAIVAGRGLKLPYVVVSDRVAALARRADGIMSRDGPLLPGVPLELSYSIECPAPGRLRFEGVRLHGADLQGFFTVTLFVRDVREYRILPRLVFRTGHPSFVKQHNALPLRGSHRHARPGSGSELLDLRDYLPGDPPKLIAWKASARRDRLMTKEFESEVPLRCTLFIDASSGVRLGPVGESALTRLVEIAAGVAQAAAAERDLTGLCLFDEAGVRRWLRPARGAQHWLRLLEALTDAACLLPEYPQADLLGLLGYAYALAQDVYPDLLQRDINALPWWLPLWAPQPSWTLRLPPVVGRTWWSRLKRRLRRSPLALQNRRGSRFSLRHHRHYRWRKQLAAILSVRYSLDPGGLALLLEDDEACVHHLQRFLAEHQVAYPHPLYDEAGRYRFRSASAVLARALLAAVSRGKDNELFVLCVDLLEAGPDLGVLEHALRVARARHHQVVLICPWPAAVPLSGSGAAGTGVDASAELPALLLQASTLRLHRAFAHLRQTFGRLGVRVLCAAEKDTVELILQRLQQMRGRGRGGR